MTRLTYLNLYTDLILLTSQIEDIALKKSHCGEEKKGDSRRKKGEIHLEGGKRDRNKEEKKKSTMNVEKEQEREYGGKKRAPP